MSWQEVKHNPQLALVKRSDNTPAPDEQAERDAEHRIPYYTVSVKFPQLNSVIRHMATFAIEDSRDMRIRRLAESICKYLKPKDYLSEYLAIYYWTLQNIRYIRDIQHVETLKRPVRLLESRQGDCDCIATFIVALITSIGGQCRFVTVGFIPYETFGEVLTHVFCEAYEPVSKRWIVLDPVAGVRTHEMLKRVKQVKVYNI